MFKAEWLQPESKISVMDLPFFWKIEKFPFATAFFATVYRYFNGKAAFLSGKFLHDGIAAGSAYLYDEYGAETVWRTGGGRRDRTSGHIQWTGASLWGERKMEQKRIKNVKKQEE